MPELIEVIAPLVSPRIEVSLPFSKSISNRLLILQAATNGAIIPINLSDADDTRALQRCLKDSSSTMNVGAGGTSLRFLLAYFASISNFTVKLSGSSRLMMRPISALISALNQLGAKVSKDENGDIRVTGQSLKGGRLHLKKSESSQFASALLLAGVQFSEGLELFLPDEFPSISYLNMTVDLMRNCGFDINRMNNVVKLNPSALSSKQVEVERDWSSASYWYLLASLVPGTEIKLNGLTLNSLQGDALVVHLFTLLGVKSTFTEDSLLIRSCSSNVSEFGLDVSDFPDLFPSLCFSVAGRRMKAYFSGLKTLGVKESNRIEAVTKELIKINVKCSLIEDDLFLVDATELRTDKTVIFETYDDHRMAMCAGILSSILWKVAVREPDVVTKSYPEFWQHLAHAGFSIDELES